MVERVEVLTGGASAVYGSDAVAGVVNFIMKKDFEGVQLDAQYGFYQHKNDFGGPGVTKLRDVIAGRGATNPVSSSCRMTTSPTARASRPASWSAPRPRMGGATSRLTPPRATTRRFCSATATSRPVRWIRHSMSTTTSYTTRFIAAAPRRRTPADSRLLTLLVRIPRRLYGRQHEQIPAVRPPTTCTTTGRSITTSVPTRATASAPWGITSSPSTRTSTHN